MEIKLPFKLTRPLCVFDLETTGSNITDKIVQISIIKFAVDGSHIIKGMIVDPECHIPKEASDIHGITDEKIAELKLIGKAPTFAKIGKGIHGFISDCDLCAYNGRRFDLPLLAESFALVGIVFPAEGVKLIDPMSIFHQKEKRDLEAAVRFYCNEDITQHHDSTADSISAIKVLIGQIDKYPELAGMNVEDLANYSTDKKLVDLAGKLAYDDNGKIIFTFGKYYQKFAYDAFKNDTKYYEWLMKADGFTSDTRRHFERLYNIVHSKQG